MCEVILQSGNVRLQHPSVSPGCVRQVWWCLMISLTTYPHPRDALQLGLRQISNNHRGVSGPTEQHFIMRGVLCFKALCVHVRRDRTRGLHSVEITINKFMKRKKKKNPKTEELSSSCWPQRWSILCQSTLEGLSTPGPSSPPPQPYGPWSPSPPLQLAETRTGDEDCALFWRLREAVKDGEALVYVARTKLGHKKRICNNMPTNLQRNPVRCRRSWPQGQVTLEPFVYPLSQPETCVLEMEAC